VGPRFHFLGVLLAFVSLYGCGGSPVVPVTGKVVFQSREQPAVCRLSFLPVGDAEGGGTLRPSGATMQPDGTYRMNPYQGVEGLLPGRYAVRVSYFDLKPGGNPDREGDWIEHTYDAAELVVPPGSSAVEHDVEVP
jgi:hypothetical protein